MPRPIICVVVLAVAVLAYSHVQAEAPPDAAKPAAEKAGHLRHVEFDVEKKQVRVECEALAVNAPLEFFCCVRGTNEHESVLRTEAVPSDIQIGLLAIGLKPGEPVTFDQAAKKWIAPHGPPLHLTVEFEKEGKIVSHPAYRWLRSQKTHKEPPAFTWVYAGSRSINGKFAADVTGYVVSIVNFDLTLIDIPELASSNNEQLEWVRNPDLMPKAGTKVWMVIEPAGKPDKPANGKADARAANSCDAPTEAAGAAADNTNPADSALSDVKIDEKRVKALRDYWQSKVAPNAAALRQAAEAHYEVITALRKEQQRLVEEADRVQRAIEQVEREYQDLTTPHPKGS